MCFVRSQHFVEQEKAPVGPVLPVICPPGRTERVGGEGEAWVANGL